MPELEIGSDAGGGGDTIAGIPKKWAIIGAGAAVMGLFFFTMKGRSGGAAATADPNAAPNTLGPNASLALGSLENTLRQRSGEIEELFTKQGAAQTATLSSLFGSGFADLTTHIDTAADDLSNQAVNYASDREREFHALSGGLGTAYNSLWQGINNLQRNQYYAARQAADPSWNPGGIDDPWRAAQNDESVAVSA